ncbi:unnamed protein product [Parnassius apollo]|uniref:(apollo) hypothetical protein n=1 Tax=Parnassius apollo TaxID=110799 RepID=A0A8S3X6Z7_PARAO|nr:unnamed protein product [Parnassius apollo]
MDKEENFSTSQYYTSSANDPDDQIFPSYLGDALAIDSGSEISDDEDITEDTLRQILESEDINDDHEEITPSNVDDFSWSDDFQTFTGVLESFTEQSGPTVSSTDPLELFNPLWGSVDIFDTILFIDLFLNC